MSTGCLHMDQKKRELSSTSSPLFEEPPAKKSLVDNKKDDTFKDLGAGHLTHDNVVDFQKEAIFRQMKVYQREKELVESRVHRVESKLRILESNFSSLDTWWNQLLDELSLAAGTVPISTITNTPASLILSATKEHSNISGSLSEKSKAIKEKLDPIFGAAKSSSKLPFSTIQEFQTSLSELTSALNSLRQENEILQSSREELSSELAEVTAKYLDAEKKYDRLKSPSLQKVFESDFRETKSEDHKPDAIQTEDNSNDKSQNGTKIDSSKIEIDESPEISQASLLELQNLKDNLAQNEAIVRKQREQLAEQEGRFALLNENIRSLSSRLVNLSEADVQQSSVYKNLALLNKDLQDQVAKLESNNTKIFTENTELLTTRSKFKFEIEQKFEQSKEEIVQQLNRAEQDVARIRSARDDILGTLNIKTAAESEKIKSLNHLKDLLNIRESRIKALEEKLSRLQDQAKDVDDKEIVVDDCSPEQLLEMVRKLQRHNKNLSAELPGLEQAFAQAHEKATAKIFDAVEREAKTNRLIAEKAKADEKYFAAMRSKDAMNLDLSRSKQQLKKSAEVIQQLREHERTNVQKIFELETSLQNLRKNQIQAEREIQNWKRKVLEAENRLSSSKNLVEKLSRDLKASDNSIRNEISFKRSLELEIEKLKKQVEAKTIGTVSGQGSDVDQQMDALRSIAICSVCSKNWKDTAIKVCGHVFCNECAKDRLNARLRKCPMCNKQYSFSDLLSIHL